MELRVERNSDVDSWKEVVLIYNSALKQISVKLEILNDEFQHVHRYNPIEHIKSRIKTSESIVKKLKRNGYESTIENMVKYVNDIAGIRVICSFTSDIYEIADMIRGAERYQGNFDKRLYCEAKGEWIQKLSYACDGAGIFVGQDCRYKSGNTDKDSCYGLLGQPGT